MSEENPCPVCEAVDRAAAENNNHRDQVAAAKSAVLSLPEFPQIAERLVGEMVQQMLLERRLPRRVRQKAPCRCHDH